VARQQAHHALRQLHSRLRSAASVATPPTQPPRLVDDVAARPHHLPMAFTRTPRRHTVPAADVRAAAATGREGGAHGDTGRLCYCNRIHRMASQRHPPCCSRPSPMSREVLCFDGGAERRVVSRGKRPPQGPRCRTIAGTGLWLSWSERPTHKPTSRSGSSAGRMSGELRQSPSTLRRSVRSS
jgi:hypothetical protein